MSATALTVSAAPEEEPISAAEAKRHLRILSPDIEDDEVLLAVAASRQWAESRVGRTLRADVTRVQSYDDWPCAPIRLAHPPLRSITSIDYYDVDDVDTEFADSNYRAVLSTNLQGWVEWAEGVTFPALATRDDAVRITYTSGYAGGAIPEAAKQAILLYTAVCWGDMNARDLAYAEKAAVSLLDACDWGSYS